MDFIIISHFVFIIKSYCRVWFLLLLKCLECELASEWVSNLFTSTGLKVNMGMRSGCYAFFFYKNYWWLHIGSYDFIYISLILTMCMHDIQVFKVIFVVEEQQCYPWKSKGGRGKFDWRIDSHWRCWAMGIDFMIFFRIIDSRSSWFHGRINSISMFLMKIDSHLRWFHVWINFKSSLMSLNLKSIVIYVVEEGRIDFIHLLVMKINYGGSWIHGNMT